MFKCYHFSITKYETIILPQKIREERGYPSLVYLHEDKHMNFCVDGLVSKYTYEIRLSRKPIRLLCDSKNWIQDLILAKQQGVDMDKLHWIPYPVSIYQLLGSPNPLKR